MTALSTIYLAQLSVFEGGISKYLKFEAVTWVIVKASAQLGVNLNDSRFPDVRPQSPDEAA